MVETLLSLLFFIAAALLALWPSLGMRDHTVDGLFLTVTGSMLSLIFLVDFIRQLRHQSAEEVAAIWHSWKKLAHAVSALRLEGGRGMRTIRSKVSVPIVMGFVLLLILAFPSRLNASSVSASSLMPVAANTHHLGAIATPKLVTGKITRRGREYSDRGLLLMDADIRLRTAAALDSNPTLKKAAESAHVPLRIIVIAAAPLIEV